MMIKQGLLGKHGKPTDNTPTTWKYVYVEYGVSVPKVAAMIQDKVKQQITLMTDLKVKEVNVHIKGIVTSKEDQQGDPNDWFGEHLNDEAGE